MLLIGLRRAVTVGGRYRFPVSFVELLAHPEVTEEQVLASPIGFLALHGGLEPGTAEIAVGAARRAGASWYVIRQPDALKRHVPSHEHDPAESPLLAGFLEHIDVVISVHGYWGHADDALLVGGRDRALASSLSAALRTALPDYRVVDDLDAIPRRLRGIDPRNPVNRALMWVYRPVIHATLRFRAATIAIAVLVLLASLWPASRLGSEFMPTLNEGTLFFMPTTLPGLSVTKAAELVQTQNKIIKGFPEVASVWGKAGRANTATDPAPTEMFETIINLKPEREWRPGLTVEKLIAEMDQAMQFPGVSNAWTMPIKARIDMLATGIRTPVGIKVYGPDLAELERLARLIEATVRTVPGTTSAFAERIIGGYYLNIDPDRAQLARYGLMITDVQDMITTALGADAVTTTVEGRERYTVSLRYPRELRSDPRSIASEVLIPLPNGGTVPLGQVAKVELAKGPATIRTENSQLAAYIYVDLRDRDLGGYVADAQKAVAAQVKLPAGYYVTWSGQFEYLERAKSRLKIVVPFTMLIIFLLLYLNFRRVTETLIVMLSVPFALAGGVWLMWWLGFNMSVAVAVGFIALAGVAAETGVVMLIYLDNALKDLKAKRVVEGANFTRDDVHSAIMAGAVERVRPKMMTVAAIMAGLLPIMWSHGTGAEVMQRIAVPMIGGMVSSTLLTLVVIPAIYAAVKGFRK